MSAEKQLEFFKNHDIEHEKLLIKFENGSYFVLAKENLVEGTVVAKIPKDSVLSIQTTAIADVIEQESLRGILGLGLAVLYEKSLGKESPWYDYLSTIPEYEQLPIFYTKEEQFYLQNTDVGRSIHEDVAFLVHDYETYILPLLNGKYPQLNKKFFTEENWIRVASLISSRAFQIDDFHGEALCPLGDLFNHKTDLENVHCEGNDEGSEWKSDADSNGDEVPILADLDSNGQEILDNSEDINEYLEFVVVRSCRKGDEVFNTYGEHPNSSLLRLYGFVDNINPYSTVTVDRKEVLSIVKVDENDERIEYWDKFAKRVVDELNNITQEEMNEAKNECCDEGCQDCDGDEDTVSEGNSVDSESKGECCEDGCNDCEENEEDIYDGFCFTKNGMPSFELIIFVALMILPLETVSKISEDLDELVDLLIQLKNEVHGLNDFTNYTFCGLLNDGQCMQARAILKSVAKNRLSLYADVERPTVEGPKMWGYLLRQEEQEILNAHLRAK